MSTEIDFKSLWNKQPGSDIPNTKDLFAKADKLKRKTRNRLIGSNVVLFSGAIFIGYIGFNIDHETLTTKLGIALIIIALITWLIAHNQILPLLFKTNPQSNSHDYLDQLINIKRKQEFLNTVIINIYFVFIIHGSVFVHVPVRHEAKPVRGNIILCCNLCMDSLCMVLFKAKRC